MSNHHHRLSRRDAEEILRAPAQSDHAVGPMLDALGAPGREGELLREDATVAAFHTARLTPAPISRSDMTLSKPARAATKAVIATGAVVALTSGGLALAATGHLPTLPDQASDKATEAVAKHTTKSASPSESATETATETPTETESPETETPETEGATPTPNLEGLCNAFQNGDRTQKGKSLDSAAFTALATAAGGKDAIATYCVELIGEPKETGKPDQAATPTKPAKPTPTKPTQAASPTKPAKPTQAATPTKPAETQHPGQPEGVGKR